MASFQAKIGWEKPRKRENNKNRSDKFLPDPEQRIPKKFKKLKNTTMASVKAKIGWERPRKRENEI